MIVGIRETPATFAALEAAYIRGATWSLEMGMHYKLPELRKAAYDYADKASPPGDQAETLADAPKKSPVEAEPVAGEPSFTSDDVDFLNNAHWAAGYEAGRLASQSGEPTSFLWTEELYTAFDAVNVPPHKVRMHELLLFWRGLTGAAQFAALSDIKGR